MSDLFSFCSQLDFSFFQLYISTKKVHSNNTHKFTTTKFMCDKIFEVCTIAKCQIKHSIL